MKHSLRSLLSALPDTGFQVIGDPDVSVEGISWDPTKTGPGFLYFALTKEEFQESHLKPNSLAHWPAAVERGAVCVVTDKNLTLDLPPGVTHLQLWDLNLGMALLAQAFWERPFMSLKLVGITGTNGKTTTTQMLDSILAHAKVPAGVIGTIGTFYPKSKEPAGHLSNPLAPDLFRIGHKMRNEGAQVVMMEVTSHGMDFDRNSALEYDVAVFTNLTQDHLDHHLSMEAYKEAKLKFFRGLGQGKKKSLAVVNVDDYYGPEFLSVLDNHAKLIGRIQALSYGIKNKQAELLGVIKEMTGASSRFEVYLRGHSLGEIRLPMAGIFNVYNALAAFGAGLGLGVNVETLAAGLAAARQVDGRFEKIKSPAGVDVYIDYAHTPDALEKIIKEVVHLTEGRNITVFGCGGDRDPGKRPLMGAIAARFAGVTVITSDNPRTEDPKTIAAQIQAGFPEEKNAKLFVELDRKRAIDLALEMAKPGDSVLIAGKGHETYQIIGEETRLFSDRQAVLDYYANPPKPHYRAIVEVNLKVVEANLRLILEEKPAHLELLLVVKDDALGHGIVPVAKLAATLGIKRFGVACLSEALALRAAGLLAPDILVFGERDDQELPIALRHKLTLQIQSLEKAERLNELAASAGQRAKVHLKVDSGMGRYGVKPHAVLELVEQISRLKNLELEGVMTHFAQSDEADKTYAKLQWERFSAVVSALEAKGQRPPLVHACNSGGYLDLPFAHGDMVRIGALLAGVYPSEVCRRINREGKTLAPALSLKSRVAFVKTLELGDKVGYGMHYTAPGATQLAILPLGYGDGYPRLRNKGAVLIQGTECPILGGNSMDAIMVDCSHLQEVSPGEEVVLIGTQGEKEITAMQLARWASTVTYQVLSCWTGRIEKRWV